MLEEYKKKRDFKRTTEPKPGKKAGEGPLAFVIQKHSASRLHYDFRLEVDGVLKSWAIPKGPSLDPKTKRLAAMVEDHPFEYRTFEGTIPKGEYGAGEVIIWDQGTYYPDEDKTQPPPDRAQAQELMRQGLEKGKISVHLNGSKLGGSWALVRMRTAKDWLLIKHHDEFAKPEKDILEEDTSVVSGLTIEDLKNGSPAAKKKAPEPAKIEGARLAPFPSELAPMLATIAKKPFSDPDWFFEPKLDGYRTITFIQDGKVKLLSRNGLDATRWFPSLAAGLSKQSVKEAALDGEVVAMDENGKTCFQCLQNMMNFKHPGGRSTPQPKFSLLYYVFDILYLDGYDLRSVPLYLRKQALAQVITPSEDIKLIEYYEMDGKTLFEASVNIGLEGVMAKLKNSPYEAGRRSPNWLKIKAVQSDEFVIGGFTEGAGNRASTFGALLLGSYDDKGKLVYAGSVGSGFDDRTLNEVLQRLNSLKAKKSPFATEPPLTGPTTWVKPELVAEVKYAEITREGYLRAPVFLRLREDKPASEVELAGSAEKEGPAENKPLSPANKKLAGILDQLADTHQNLELNVEGFKISVTNLDKEIWPSTKNLKGSTKRDLLVYLAKVSPYMLNHLQDRPITLTRYPGGIYSEHFFQKHWDSPLPGFVETVSLSESEPDGKDYLMCNNLATLLWLGQLANIEFHSWFSNVKPVPLIQDSEDPEKNTADLFTNYPDYIIFDVDPYIYSGKEDKGAEPELNKKAFEQTCQAALWLKETLDSLSLNSFIKTSGKTGLHIHVPIERQYDFQTVRSLAKTIGGFVLQNHPKDITMDWAVASRTGKIFLDYNQNVRGKTLASVYSPRPSPQATVSAPFTWNEIGKIYPTDFTIQSMPDRLAKTGDIWSGILDERSDLNKVVGKVG